MPDHDSLPTSLAEYVAAMMLHDLCKAVLDDPQIEWGRHASFDPRGVTLAGAPVDGAYLDDLLGAAVTTRIRGHHGDVDDTGHTHKTIGPDRSRGQTAAMLADRIQKSMIAASYMPPGALPAAVNEKCLAGYLNELKSCPPFYPYYGPPVRRWSFEAARDEVFLPAIQALRGPLTFERLLAAQRPLRVYPHTTYLPHLSLAMHQRFAAALFLLIHKQFAALQERPNTELKEIRFAVITVLPDEMELFYRLRDLAAQTSAAEVLRADLYEAALKAGCAGIPGSDALHNPFSFYSGDGMVVVHDDPQQILDALQRSADERKAIRSLSVEVLDYRVRLKWPDGRFDLQLAETKSLSILQSGLTPFPAHGSALCRRCNLPLAEAGEDGYCPRCRELLGGLGVIDLQAVAEEGEEESGLGYVFLSLPDDLRRHAVRAGRGLLERMRAEVRANGRGPADPRDYIQPTHLGLFEYLEAVLAMDSFQRDLAEDVRGLGVYPVARLPRLSVWVMRADALFAFLDRLEPRLAELHLEPCARAILCHAHTPVWSLLDRFSEYERSGMILAVFTGGETLMFSEKEIKAIRRLAGYPKSAVTKNQLSNLINKAQGMNTANLVLEIDVILNQGKIAPDFAADLTGELEALGETSETKRSEFIKKIRDLGQFEK